MTIRILALDSATEACSVALWNQGEITGRYQISPRESSQLLLPMVQALLADSGLSLQQLDALAFARGPGSFTGIRIGIGIAQGLALGADLAMIPVSTLKTLAQGAWRLEGKSTVISAIDARMAELYWAVYQRESDGQWLEKVPEQVITPEKAQNSLSQLPEGWAMAGTGWQSYPYLAGGTMEQPINTTILLPDAQDMLPLAIAGWNHGESVPVEQAEPIYLRNEVAWKKLPGR
ncbi:MAG: tRNA (adenosine(37)-N6)-threonylcarbamoyltransferase complex dimerization subunit type 1 TsaB [Enterobacteriaceae bacterium]